jgi:hypothetical protein
MGRIVAFKRPTKPRREELLNGKRRVTGFAVSLQSRQDAVFLVTDDVELGLSPAQARELAHDLLELADDAEGVADD